MSHLAVLGAEAWSRNWYTEQVGNRSLDPRYLCCHYPVESPDKSRLITYCETQGCMYRRAVAEETPACLPECTCLPPRMHSVEILHQEGRGTLCNSRGYRGYGSSEEEWATPLGPGSLLPGGCCGTDCPVGWEGEVGGASSEWKPHKVPRILT